MGFGDLFKVFSGHYGKHHGDRHRGGYDHQHHDHHGHDVRYRDPCGQNSPDHSVPPASVAETCPKCTSAVQVGFKFCPSCGASLEPVACKGCGVKLQPNAAFCSGCGAKA